MSRFFSPSPLFHFCSCFFLRVPPNAELALLRLEPRAATIRAIVRTDPSAPKLKVAALGVAAFTRLLGPLRDIMERKAGDYGGMVPK